MKFIKHSNSVRISGNFIITDPCYIFDGGDYNEICENLNYDKNEGFAIFETEDGKRIYVASTALGDGCYPVLNKDGTHIGTFGVDSGMFCLAPDTLGLTEEGPLVRLDGVLEVESGDAWVDGSLVVDTSGETFVESEDEDFEEEEEE